MQLTAIIQIPLLHNSKQIVGSILVKASNVEDSSIKAVETYNSTMRKV